MSEDGHSTVTNIPFATLRQWAMAMLVAAGASDKGAEATADACISASRRGLDSHGIVYLSVYLPRLRSGIVDGQAEPEVIEQRPGLALVDGHFALGALVGGYSMRWCCDRAEPNGVAAAVTRNSSHFGATSYYSEMAAQRGCIGVVVSNSDPGLGPEGSLAPILGTNPIAIAAPASDDGDHGLLPSLDIATSSVAQGRVVVAARRGETIPLGWAIGRDGRSTVDPDEALSNAMLPVGGYKGFGLAFMIDVLTGCLGGGNISPDLVDERGTAQLFVAIKVGAIASGDDYRQRLRRLIGDVHDAPRADWADPFLVPGEREANTARDRGEMLRLDASSVALLRALGDEYGVRFPES